MLTPTVYFVRVMLMSLLAGHQAFAQASYRPGVTVTAYALSIDLPDSGSSIHGAATLTVQRTAQLDTLTRDLRELRVTRVTVDSRSTRFARTDSTIGIPLPRGAGGTFKVRVVYDGVVTDGLIAR